MKGYTFRPDRGGTVTTAVGEGRVEVSCFADEVVVDFPSVAAALDRMRRSFLAEERAFAQRLPLALTRAEAREGARVPMEVQVRCTCRGCGGRGESWAEWCSRCAGTGAELLSHQVQVSVPAGVRDGERFHFTVTPRHDAPTRIELEIVIR